MPGEDLGKNAPEGAAGWKGYKGNEEQTAQYREYEVGVREEVAADHNAERPLMKKIIEKATFTKLPGEVEVAHAEADKVDANFEAHKEWQANEEAKIKESREKFTQESREKLQAQVSEMKETLAENEQKLRDIVREREDGLRDVKDKWKDYSGGDMHMRDTGFMENLKAKEDGIKAESVKLEREITKLEEKIESVVAA